MKITCVCGMGMGSSLIAKMNVDSILAEAGIGAEVDNCDLGSVSGTDTDWYVTTRELADNMPENTRSRLIVLTDFINVDAMRDEILRHLQ